MDGDVKPSGLPKVKYNFPDWFADYIKDAIGIVVSHQGFDNNILMAEAFMKVLPQVFTSLGLGMLNNPMTHQMPKTEIDPLLVKRIKQIWFKGVYCIVIRNPNAQEQVIKRVLAYPSRNEKIKIGKYEYRKPWDVAMSCPFCGAGSEYVVGFMTDPEFTVAETECIIHCLECNKERTFPQVEVKPAFKDMSPIRPVGYNPVWVQIRAFPMVRYALEGIDLFTLASNDGGFGKEINGVFIPRFNSHEEILESTANTQFVSQKYFHDTMDIEFQEWLFYYNFLLPLIHKLITEKNRISFSDTPKKTTPRIESVD